MSFLETLKKETTALFIIDLQKGYCAPNGDAAIALNWNCKPMDEVCKRHVSFLEQIRLFLPPEKIIWARMEEHEDTIAQSMPKHNQGNFFTRLCVRGTDGFNYHIVSPKEGEKEIFKTHFSLFHKASKLTTVGKNGKKAIHPDDYLQSIGIETLVFTGVLETRCVLLSLASAGDRDYKNILLTDLSDVPIGRNSASENNVGFNVEKSAVARVRDLALAESTTSALLIKKLVEQKASP